MKKNLEKINKSALRFLQPLTQTELYEVIVQEALNLVSATYGSIYLEQGGRLVRVYTSVPDSQRVTIREEGFTFRAFTEGKAYALGIRDIARVHPELENLGVKTVLFIPLSYRDKCIGVLSVDSTKRNGFDNDDKHLLYLFGSMATLAIKKAELYDQTHRALKLRDLFISLASHELKTPLTTINAYVQLLQRANGALQQRERGWVRELSTEVGRLSDMVEELLTVNQINTGKMKYTFAEHNLYQIVTSAVERFRFVHPTRTINVELPQDAVCTIIADGNKLLQVITNLLDNAAKFSDPERPIGLTLTTKPERYTVTVKDEGKGIPPEDIERVFEGFYRGSNSKQEKGMGLGLHITKNIIEAHKGTIEISSEISRGTTIEVTLGRPSLDPS